MPDSNNPQQDATAHTARQHVPRPVETDPGALVHSSADRMLAVSHWLLAAHPTPAQAQREWTDSMLALLPLGTLFSAVRIPKNLVHAIIGRVSHEEVDEFLADMLDGGPVICDPRQQRYYVLVPGSMPETWTAAAAEWMDLGVECLGRGAYLGVPRVEAVALNPVAWASYWAVPMPSAGELCSPLAVARLLAAGKRCLTEAADV